MVNDFKHFLHESGLVWDDAVATREVQSPFDHAKQGRLVVVQTAADPKDVDGYTREMLEAEFGPTVAGLVSEVTEDNAIYDEHPELPHVERVRMKKQDYLERLMDDSEGALMIAAADKICNTRSFLEEYPKLGSKFWEGYRGTPERYLRFSLAFNEIIQSKLSHPLAIELDRVTKAAENIINETESRRPKSN